MTTRTLDSDIHIFYFHEKWTAQPHSIWIRFETIGNGRQYEREATYTRDGYTFKFRGRIQNTGVTCLEYSFSD